MQDATFYSIYPLGFCAAGAGPGEAPLATITHDLPRIASLGFSALYLGPLFDSGSHGYDTRDYFRVDPRLGDDDDFARLVARAHDHGIRVVIDGVYNHVGRGFHAFQRLRAEGPGSEWAAWFRAVDFSRDNRFGDGFTYEGWEGVDELVVLNHRHRPVRDHLIAAATHAIKRYGVDGIRLDVAYSLPLDFLDELAAAVRATKPDAWLLGEIIHGDYAALVAPGRLDSVTNYECYKGLWSSCNDRNMHEIAHSLRRLFGDGGLLAGALSRGALPYSFADNHDVSRVAATLNEERHLFPLYGLLWGMPGIPSVYYGSEYAAKARKEDGDSALRPPRDAVVPETGGESIGSRLAGFIAELNRVRASSAPLRTGAYGELAVSATTLAFARKTNEGEVIVAANINGEPARVALSRDVAGTYRCLFSGERLSVDPADPVVPVPAAGVRMIERV